MGTWVHVHCARFRKFLAAELTILREIKIVHKDEKTNEIHFRNNGDLSSTWQETIKISRAQKIDPAELTDLWGIGHSKSKIRYSATFK